MPETKYEGYRKGEDVIQKCIFPGGHIPTVTQLAQSITRSSQGRLIVDNIKNIDQLWLWKEKVRFEFRRENMASPLL
jgi:cyclopropane-fatty-acyl-phospholipid synthase